MDTKKIKEEVKLYGSGVKQLAKTIHDFYEIHSRDIGWETQRKCKVDFDDLPIENKLVMLRIANWLISWKANFLSKEQISFLSDSIATLKLDLYHLLLECSNSAITENEVNIMYFLSKDKDIQKHLDKVIDKEKSEVKSGNSLQG